MSKMDITKQEWDYLIVLDACRYDYFEETYQDYVQGDLSRVTSVGSCTDQWRDLSFPDYYDDIVYISANPQICASTPVYGYRAGDHFCRVHEIWKDGWDREKGTVLPQTLTKSAIEIISRSPNSGKRYIIHYLQPHAPYLSLSNETRGYINADINKVRSLVGADGNEPVSRFKKMLLKQLTKLFQHNRLLTNQPQWLLRRYLGIAPKAPMEAAWRSIGPDALPSAYKDNLIAVLQQVAVLLKSLSGRIVITSDHGELLGEDRCYAHPRGSANPLLTTVPWLVIEKQVEGKRPAPELRTPVEKDIAPAQNADQTSEEEIVDKLRALGYHD